ncbi:hypothetical protein AB0J35_50180 [Nonomuraea angiospora]|uniref:hypothetical protein n=1 Tax=Nonomuraea angiospora TaxID=46172 RepID=UPI00341EBF83
MGSSSHWETRAVLDAIAPELLSFGPDTGHLHWAGADPAELITRYRDRVGAAHLVITDRLGYSPTEAVSLVFTAALVFAVLGALTVIPIRKVR